MRGHGEGNEFTSSAVALKFLAQEVIGIPYLILLVEVLCLVGYWTWQRYLWAGARAQPI
jgi:hypothetical protein